MNPLPEREVSHGVEREFEKVFSEADHRGVGYGHYGRKY
jgi:hypothetical protein